MTTMDLMGPKGRMFFQQKSDRYVIPHAYVGDFQPNLFSFDIGLSYLSPSLA